MAVQVNGKVRSVMVLPPGVSQIEVEKQARALPNVAKYLSGKEVVNLIFVQDKLVNFVVMDQLTP